jgi:7-cyano-7-deazaguanine reductase
MSDRRERCLQGMTTASGHGDTLLGKETVYPEHFSAELLTPLSRRKGAISFRYGEDIWNAYEVSWLNREGLPQIALAEFIVPATSPALIESKSFKLYLNSFNQAGFDSPEVVRQQMAYDLSAAAGAAVSVSLILPDGEGHIAGAEMCTPADCAQALLSLLNEQLALEQPQDAMLKASDRLAVNLLGATAISPARCIDFPGVLGKYATATGIGIDTGIEQVCEALFSNLLKTNCPVTGQPDWATVFVVYQGGRISETELLDYVVSMRNHQDFHEQCVEQIFDVVRQRYQPDRLLVYARYTRRGGLDINPWRSTHALKVPNLRLIRQ